jgi:hypothetical protein
MLGILYGAEKYILPGLMAQAYDYTSDRINETNCMDFYNSTHLLDCPRVNEICLNHFRLNPWKFFKDDLFLKLSLSAVRKIAGLTTMNCTGPDMKSAVLEWLVANGHCESVEDISDEKLWQQGFEAHNFGVKEFYGLQRDGSHAMVLQKFVSNTTNINFKRNTPVKLNGVGICAGIPGSQEYELVQLTISQGQTVIFNIERRIKQTSSFAIIDIVFEEAIPVLGKISIKVDFKTEKQRPVITNSLCTHFDHYNYEIDTNYNNSYHNYDRKTHLYDCSKMWPENSQLMFTSLAYLIR